MRYHRYRNPTQRIVLRIGHYYWDTHPNTRYTWSSAVMLSVVGSALVMVAV